MLLVLLREELLRYDATPAAVASIPTVEQPWLIEQMAAFVPERNNRVKRQGAIEQVIRAAVTMGVLRDIDSTAEAQTYQIMRIVKAKLPEEKLTEVRDRLKAAPGTVPTEGPDGNTTND
jgi:1,2-phenylacetyl-CoA epoxidase catalytic subunit